MNLFNGLLLSAVDILNLDVTGCAIALGICVVLAILLAVAKCQIVYVDTEGDYEISYEKVPVFTSVNISPAEKAGKEFVGWAYDPEGEEMVTVTEKLLWHTVQLYAIWEDAVEEEEEEAVEEGVFVQINYMKKDGSAVLDSESIKLNVLLPEEHDIPLEVKGWSAEQNGELVLSKDDSNASFAINLYPIFDEEGEFEGEVNPASVIELLFVDGEKGSFIYKEAHYVSLNAPADFEDDESFAGWGVVPNGDVVVERNDNDSAFTIQLFSVACEPKAIPEVIDEEPEVIIEPDPDELVPVDEVVDEVVEEEPVDEVVEEEPVDEVVEEAPVDEVVEEEPVEEVIEEAPVDEVVEEEPVEEVIEEAPVDEVVEEEPAEEVIEEAPVDEVVEEEPVVEEPVEEPVAEVPEEVVIPEPVIVPTYIDNEGNTINIKYSRSFTANIIQGEDVIKDYYSQLKNHIMSYKGVKSKISWKFDSYNKGRNQLFKIKPRGKTICLYCAIDPEELDKSKYHHDAIDNKLFADVPSLLKIKSGLGLRKAKEVVDLVMAKFEIEKNEKAKEVDYVAMYPYEETESLLAKKLVKALQATSDVVVVSNKPKEEEVVEETPVVEEVVEEEPEVVAPVVVDSEGNPLDIRYSRSVTANIIQGEESVKDFYSQIKNYILSYKGVKSRFSWKFDSFNKGRVHLFKIKVRGKTVKLYCAIAPEELDQARYHYEVTESKQCADVPTALKIKSALGLKKAKEVVDLVMAKLEIVKNPKAQEVDYVAAYPYEDTPTLVAKGLIKELKASADDEAPVAEETPAIEEVVEETPVEEEPVEEVVEETPVEEEPVVEEVVEEEPVEEEPVVEEVVEEEPVEEEPVEEVVEEAPVVEQVDAESAHNIIEEKHIEVVVEEDVDYITAKDNKKCIVNIDTLSQAFNAGDVVDLAALKAKGLVDKKAKSVKVLARGVLDKPLTVKAGTFSDTAVEMIVLTGGHAVHVNYKVK